MKEKSEVTVKDADREDTNVKGLLKHYARNSSMHGVPSIVDTQLYRGRHIFWVIVVLVMAALLVTTIYVQLSDYYRYPTVTSVNIRYVDEDDFPAVTICDLNIFNKEFIQDMSNRTQMAMPHLTEITGIYHLVGKRLLTGLYKNAPPIGNKSAEEIVDTIFTQVDSMIKGTGLRCAWGDYYWEDCSAALTTRVTEMGICFTVDTLKLKKTKKVINPNPVSNALRGLSVLVTTSRSDIPYRLYQFEGFKVVLHDVEEDPLPQSRGFVVGANCSSEIEVSKHVRIGLEPPFKAFGGSTCVDTNSDKFVNPLKRYENYTKEACENECFIDYVVQTCGCRHFLHKGNESLCHIDRLIKCYREAEKDYYRGGTAKSECICPLPCKESTHKASISCAKFRATESFEKVVQNLDADVVVLHFFFADPVVTVIEQVPVYTLEKLLGSIGGQVGLFMGFSLITVAEMFELIFLLVTRGRLLHQERYHAEAEMRRLAENSKQ
ncbi:hypothetical protein LOTGIDRAFT_163011 [Lottia gigantea]|uniref:Uncharacterized protein n=1 Tax=Lottia gigantea TaxID=225164 RepID=V4AAA6_LOTGI|nr:hypothetical protein LOTGIDRAFT_163011 [Lottia gigantea]ESO92005.1 hypothetical protein LOTGIDRAFT_163011 [Lottia gigantea]